MIEIDIPSIDPIQHEPKIFLGLNKRQLLVSLPCAALGAIVVPSLVSISQDAAVLGFIVCAAPAVVLGWYKPYNMKFEDYAQLWFFNTFINPQKRIYKTDNAEDIKMLTMKERAEIEKKENAAKKSAKKKKKEEGEL